MTIPRLLPALCAVLAALLPPLAAQDEVRTPDLDWQFVRDFFKSHTEETLVCVKKTDYTLVVVDRRLKIVFRTGVAVGKNPDLKAKVFAHDNRTPEGLYRVTQSLHADLPQGSDGYSRLRRMNSVYFSASEGHSRWKDPAKDLGTNVYGYGFFRLSYPTPLDRQRYIDAVRRGIVPKNDGGELAGFGYGIGIHGTNDPDSIGHPASTGCVRVRNADLSILRRFLEPGRFVYIEH